jgi:transketolase
MFPKITDPTQLIRKVLELKIKDIQMLDKADSGHIGGAFSAADILVYLYYNQLKHDPQNPNWAQRDYFLLSNGHICPIWYAILADTGYFPVSDLDHLRQIDSHLQGHPLNTYTPGVYNSSGPLGHGLGQAVGTAIGLKLDDKPNLVYCLMSDGEQQEGATWESMNEAAKFKLDNLICIIDVNKIQIEGYTKDILPLPDFSITYSQAGFDTYEVNGHDFSQIDAAFSKAVNAKNGKPKVIISNTTAGKGVSFMENNPAWHDWKDDEALAKKAISELQTQLNSLQQDK